MTQCKDCVNEVNTQSRRKRGVPARHRCTDETVKYCPCCRCEKLRSEFPKSRGRKDGLHPYCKACHQEKHRQWKEQSPTAKAYYQNYLREWERRNPRRRDYERYRLNPGDRERMLEEQHHACWICGVTPTSGDRGLCVDHDHDTGEVRALLCHQCNFIIGNCGENPLILFRALDYLYEKCLISLPQAEEPG